jgi:hypothetical protein
MVAANVRIFEMGGEGTGGDKTSDTVRFKSADENVANNNNRLSIPSAGGTTISFAKQLQYYFATAPDTDITNIKAYSDGVNNISNVNINYRPVGTWQGMGTTYGTSIASGSSLFSLTSAVSLDMRGTSSHGTFTGVGFKGGLLALQMEVGPDATSGSSSVETVSFQYDES